MGRVGRILGSSWGEPMTDVVMRSPLDAAAIWGETSPFAVCVTYVNSAPAFGTVALSDAEYVHGPTYLSHRAGFFFGGSWDEVAARVGTDASTSSQGSLVKGIEGDPHPKPLATSRIRQLKEDAGLTWDQVRRLFGVSRRAVHLWAGGARMNAQNEERLAYLEQVVSAVGGATADQRRDILLGSERGGGRSIFQRLVSLASQPSGVDIEALTESSGAGPTVHGDFLFAEEIDDGEEDR